MTSRRLGGHLTALALAAALAGCASRPRGVPIDARPTPAQPPPIGSAPAPEASPSPAPRPTVSDATSADERRVRLRRITADTTAVAAALRPCTGRKLLPDQESTYDATRELLVQTRAALRRDELWRAESLARKARQLAGGLACP